jgi:hypothetical protein
MNRITSRPAAAGPLGTMPTTDQVREAISQAVFWFVPDERQVGLAGGRRPAAASRNFETARIVVKPRQTSLVSRGAGRVAKIPQTSARAREWPQVECPGQSRLAFPSMTTKIPTTMVRRVSVWGTAEDAILTKSDAIRLEVVITRSGAAGISRYGFGKSVTPRRDPRRPPEGLGVPTSLAAQRTTGFSKKRLVLPAHEICPPISGSSFPEASRRVSNSAIP